MKEGMAVHQAGASQNTHQTFLVWTGSIALPDPNEPRGAVQMLTGDQYIERYKSLTSGE